MAVRTERGCTGGGAISSLQIWSDVEGAGAGAANNGPSEQEMFEEFKGGACNFGVGRSGMCVGVQERSWSA